MTTVPDVDSVMKHTLSTWYEDGLADLALGGYFLVLGTFALGQALTPPGSPLWLLWATGTPLVILLGGVATGWAIRRLKARLTYPRTGYINFERRYTGLSGAGRILAVVLLAAVISAGSVVLSGRLANLTLIFGLVLSGAFAYLGQRVGLRRYLAVGLWCLVLGVALAALPLTMEQGGAAFYALAGAGLAVSGFAAWRRFDRIAPKAEDGDAEG
jgi:hypothetical protein